MPLDTSKGGSFDEDGGDLKECVAWERALGNGEQSLKAGAMPWHQGVDPEHSWRSPASSWEEGQEENGVRTQECTWKFRDLAVVLTPGQRSG